MTLLSIKPTKNNTTRFTVLGKQGFFRVRTTKNRFGFGPMKKDPAKKNSFKQVHFAKFTLAIESRKGRSIFNFSKNAK